MLLALLTIILVFSIFVNIVLFILIKKLDTKLTIYENWINFFQKEIQEVDRQLKAVDVISGTEGTYRLFEKDDDVGFVFSAISRIISEFNTRIK
jgi:hypothetical protein